LIIDTEFYDHVVQLIFVFCYEQLGKIENQFLHAGVTINDLLTNIWWIAKDKSTHFYQGNAVHFNNTKHEIRTLSACGALIYKMKINAFYSI
jgi:hypothetical protein